MWRSLSYLFFRSLEFCLRTNSFGSIIKKDISLALQTLGTTNQFKAKAIANNQKAVALNNPIIKFVYKIHTRVCV
jgi:hypothetical protein